MKCCGLSDEWQYRLEGCGPQYLRVIWEACESNFF